MRSWPSCRGASALKKWKLPSPARPMQRAEDAAGLDGPATLVRGAAGGSIRTELNRDLVTRWNAFLPARGRQLERSLCPRLVCERLCQCLRLCARLGDAEPDVRPRVRIT
jgi:hypothetical protein